VSLVLLTRLDRESLDGHQMALVAVDGGSPARSATLILSVTVQDANDNVPQFEAGLNAAYEAEVVENMAVGMSILQVNADDPDSDLNGQVRTLFEASHFFVEVGCLGLCSPFPFWNALLVELES
jgi:hypothetical protein